MLNTSDPFPNAFDPARTMEEVLEIASQFIVGEQATDDGRTPSVRVPTVSRQVETSRFGPPYGPRSIGRYRVRV